MFRFVTTFQKWHEKIGVFVVNLKLDLYGNGEIIDYWKKEKKEEKSVRWRIGHYV